MGNILPDLPTVAERVTAVSVDVVCWMREKLDTQSFFRRDRETNVAESKT